MLILIKVRNNNNKSFSKIDKIFKPVSKLTQKL